ncbi:hypothetical protein FEE95_02690 [Maribacter algarum]|uniref:Gliding motility protein GldL-like N-terminal domain-containing protein n=1 Tax=Maribacter algarum (ex Zhang et al. 2020) TaxID=2578118 RepID=A0A5S3PTP8_9FLAO|nr:hypothetical protein [Maribacter algarum]TMM58355.1 hypothetical protein FEE95_02690 [Maribacter algarum]
MIISKQQTRLCLRLSIAVAILGILFKIMHWPYPGVLLLTGTLGIAIFYSLRFSQKHPKTLLDYSKLFLLIAFLFHYKFKVFHLAYGYIFTTIMQVAFVLLISAHIREVWFLDTDADTDEIDSPSVKSKPRQRALSYLLYSLAGIGIFMGYFFKILRWEFGFINGNVLLTIGLLAAAITVLLGASSKEPQ